MLSDFPPLEWAACFSQRAEPEFHGGPCQQGQACIQQSRCSCMLNQIGSAASSGQAWRLLLGGPASNQFKASYLDRV